MHLSCSHLRYLYLLHARLLLFLSSMTLFLFKIVLLKISSLLATAVVLALASFGRRSRSSSLHPLWSCSSSSNLAFNFARQSFKRPTELKSPPSTTTHLQRHHWAITCIFTDLRCSFTGDNFEEPGLGKFLIDEG